jgi:hypothetical protein
MQRSLRNLFILPLIAVLAGGALPYLASDRDSAGAQSAGPFVAFLPWLAADDTPSAEAVAALFVKAWLDDDDDGLALYGDLAAIASAQGTAVSSDWVFSNCQGVAGSVFCTWVRPGERVRARVNNVDVPKLVVEFQFAELSSEEAAKELFDAWKAGSDDAIRALASTAAAAAAIALETRAPETWSFDRCEGAAGSIFCTWRRGASALIIRVENLAPPAVITEFRIEG